MCAHLSLDSGLGSGRSINRGFPAVRVAGGDKGKLVSRDPDFLCSGSSPIAPAMSLSIGQEPARPCAAIGQEPERAWWWWWWWGWCAGSVATAPWPASAGLWVGGEEGGERGFFLDAAPERSFNKPPAFLSFWGWREEQNKQTNKQREKGWWGSLLSWDIEESLQCLKAQKINTPSKLLYNNEPEYEHSMSPLGF